MLNLIFIGGVLVAAAAYFVLLYFVANRAPILDDVDVPTSELQSR
jgi:hypothetical protein